MNFKTISEALEIFLNNINHSKDNENEKISNSINSWSFRRNSGYYVNENQLKKSQIVYVDFGLNFKPEMAYTHPAIILKVKNHLCVVHPCTSNTEKVKNAFHPIYNPDGVKTLYFLKSGEGGVIRDTAVVLTQIHTISVGRIVNIFDITGIHSNDFENICNESFKLIYKYQFNHLQEIKKNSLLKMNLKALNNTKETTQNETINYEELVDYSGGNLVYNEISTKDLGIKYIEFYVKDEFDQESEHVIIKVIVTKALI